MRGKKENIKQLRIDKKHRFPLRINESTHCEIEAQSFRHNLSLNLLYVEAIEFAKDNPLFEQHITEKYGRDNRRGHFVYYQDSQTLHRGRLIE